MTAALPDVTEPFDLPALRSRIHAVTRAMQSDFDQRTLDPVALVHFHLALNALDAARIHVEAARLANERRSPRRAEPSLAAAAAVALRSVPGVEAVFLTSASPVTVLYAVGREHETVDGCALREAESRLAGAWGDLEVHVRAHQGRGVDSLGLSHAQRIV